jgi:hypothetical protein
VGSIHTQSWVRSTRNSHGLLVSCSAAFVILLLGGMWLECGWNVVGMWLECDGTCDDLGLVTSLIMFGRYWSKKGECLNLTAYRAAAESPDAVGWTYLAG